MNGIGPGSKVVATRDYLSVGVGNALIGRVIDGMGRPIDGKGEIVTETTYPVKTIDALKLAASEVEKFNPEVTLIMSPHAVALNGEKVPVQVTDKYTGDFADFGAPHVTMRYDCSTEDAYALKGCGASAIRYGLMDHGSMVPLYYLRPSSPLVIMGYAFSLSTKVTLLLAPA